MHSTKRWCSTLWQLECYSDWRWRHWVFVLKLERFVEGLRIDGTWTWKSFGKQKIWLMTGSGNSRCKGYWAFVMGRTKKLVTIELFCWVIGRFNFNVRDTYYVPRYLIRDFCVELLLTYFHECIIRTYYLPAHWFSFFAVWYAVWVIHSWIDYWLKTKWIIMSNIYKK